MFTGFDLEEGKRYVRRDGTVTEKLVRKDFSGIEYLVDPDYCFLYDARDSSGNKVFSDPENQHDCDLVQEYVDVA